MWATETARQTRIKSAEEAPKGRHERRGARGKSKAENPASQPEPQPA